MKAAGALLLAIVIVGVAAAASAQDLTGTYKASGKDPSGEAYSEGTAKISKSGDVYTVAWSYPGEGGYKGIGFLKNDILCIGWGKGGKEFGVSVYEIDGGKLKGRWSGSKDEGKIESEELEGPASLNGDFTIMKDSTGATGKVRITPKGEVYDVVWKLEGERNWKGVGVRLGDLLVVGWGTGTDCGVMAYKNKGGVLEGPWVSKGESKTGNEKLVK